MGMPVAEGIGELGEGVARGAGGEVSFSDGLQGLLVEDRSNNVGHWARGSAREGEGGIVGEADHNSVVEGERVRMS